jgi:hypothetical protein
MLDKKYLKFKILSYNLKDFISIIFQARDTLTQLEGFMKTVGCQM